MQQPTGAFQQQQTPMPRAFPAMQDFTAEFYRTWPGAVLGATCSEASGGDQGVVLVDLDPHGLIAQSGLLQRGDIIFSINEVAVHDATVATTLLRDAIGYVKVTGYRALSRGTDTDLAESYPDWT